MSIDVNSLFVTVQHIWTKEYRVLLTRRPTAAILEVEWPMASWQRFDVRTGYGLGEARHWRIHENSRPGLQLAPFADRLEVPRAPYQPPAPHPHSAQARTLPLFQEVA